jgi:hypothetical protein
LRNLLLALLLTSTISMTSAFNPDFSSSILFKAYGDDNSTGSNVNATSAELVVNQSGVSQSEISKGVPFLIHLSYDNGSFLTTGNITYRVKFNFSEPFFFSGVDKGSFDNALIINNDTIQFGSTPLSKGQNKTGIVTFLFNDGLAEKSRKVSLDANLTLESIENTVSNITEFKEELPLFTNGSGTFANSTSLFSNKTTFATVFGENPQPIAPDLIKSISLNTLTSNLNNFTSAELAGVINTIPTNSSKKVLLEGAPPISPPTTFTNHTRIGPINSSFFTIDVVIKALQIVPGLISNFSSAIHTTYTTWTPCISFDSMEHSQTETTPIGSVAKYLVKINNCADIFEKVGLGSQSSVKDITHFFSIDKFDMPPKSVKDIDLYMIIPPNTIPGNYYFNILGNVFNPTNNIAAETTGRIPLTILP